MAYNRDYMQCLVRGGGIGFNIWGYDTVDSQATTYAAGYIADASYPYAGSAGQQPLGMEKGDIVIIRHWTTAVPTARSEKLTAAGTANILTAVYIHLVLGINATTGAADLTDGLAITITNT